MIAAQLGLLATDVTTVLAQSDVQAPGGQGPEFGKAAPVGLVVVLLLLIGTVLLVRSMNRQLRKVPTSFAGDDAPDATADPGTAEGLDDAPTGVRPPAAP